jgi:hypothetical protein
MNTVLAIIVFAIVLFVYIHIYHHLKVGNDLDVYEVEFPSKERFEEICSVRQPALFDLQLGDLEDLFKRSNVCGQYSAFDVNIRNLDERKSDEQIFVPLALGAADELLRNGTKNMLSEKNSDFLEETGLVHQMRHNDGFLRPPLVSNCKYDWLVASEGAQTPFRYEVSYRTFFAVNEGSVKVKLAAPKSGKFLYTNKDYNNFEFRSPINPWDVQPQYKADFNKIKCLELSLQPGKVFYLPAYWWYSIEFAADSSVSVFNYSTYMSNLSILHLHFISFLQRNNTKHKLAKVSDTSGEVEVASGVKQDNSINTSNQ